MLSSGSRRAYEQIRDDYADDDDGEDDDESMSFDRIVSSSRRRIVEPLLQQQQQQNHFDAPWSIATLNDESGQLGQYVRSELESNAADWARYDTDSSQKNNNNNNDMPMSPLAMDSAPIDDLMVALRRSLLHSSCQAQSAEVFRFILQNESCLLLTEDLEYTKSRSAYSHFEQNCRLRVGQQQQPLKLWREKWIGPWAGMQLCILEDQEQRTLNELVSLILNTTGAVVDMYLLDECFYVFCVFTPVEDTTLYGFEGFLFTQSSQSHRGDMARHNYYQHQQS